MNAQPIIKLGVPKGSLEEATINLFDRAGWKIRKHTRNYFPEINDPEISASLCRVQEIGGYVAAGILDVGIVGLDWLHEVEHDKDVQIISELAYSVGFSDPKYFSVCFKKEFGVLPTEYLEHVLQKK